MKAAAGAVEHLPIALVARDRTGAHRARAARRVDRRPRPRGERSLDELEIATEPLAIVVGAEGDGLAPLVRSAATSAAGSRSRAGRIAERSVAAAVALFACWRGGTHAGPGTRRAEPGRTRRGPPWAGCSPPRARGAWREGRCAGPPAWRRDDRGGKEMTRGRRSRPVLLVCPRGHPPGCGAAGAGRSGPGALPDRHVVACRAGRCRAGAAGRCARCSSSNSSQWATHPDVRASANRTVNISGGKPIAW